MRAARARSSGRNEGRDVSRHRAEAAQTDCSRLRRSSQGGSSGPPSYRQARRALALRTVRRRGSPLRAGECMIKRRASGYVRNAYDPQINQLARASSTEVRYTTAFSDDNPQACVIM
ncbi:unnamed protein product [Rhodiola kirilowii]